MPNKLAKYYSESGKENHLKLDRLQRNNELNRRVKVRQIAADTNGNFDKYFTAMIATRLLHDVSTYIFLTVDNMESLLDQFFKALLTGICVVHVNSSLERLTVKLNSAGKNDGINSFTR